MGLFTLYNTSLHKLRESLTCIKKLQVVGITQPLEDALLSTKVRAITFSQAVRCSNFRATRFLILLQESMSPAILTLFELFQAAVAHPGGLIVIPLQGCLAAGASATNDTAASAAVVAPGEEGELGVALLAHGHAPIWHPDRRLLSQSLRVRPRGRVCAGYRLSHSG